MSFSNYKGSLELGAGLTPSGEGYPLMQTCDIMAAEDGTRLDVLLANMASNLGVNIDGELAEQARLIQEIRASLEDKSGVGRICIQDGYWYIDGENTGVKAVAEDGKSAYSYAASAGYTGTETEFAEMLAGIDNSMCGTWVFNDTIEVLTGDHEMKFTNSADESFVGIHYVENGPIRILTYVYADGSGASEAYRYYPEAHWYYGRKNKTIVITEEPTDKTLISWIKNNAKKSGIQREADVRLKTKDKRIVDAINELSDQIADGGANGLEIVTTTGTSSAYEATVTGITELKSGVSFVMIPHITNTGISTLKVNDFDALPIWRNTSNGGSSLLFTNILISGKPTTVMYYETDSLRLWLLTDMTQPLADDLSGIVPIVNGGVPATSAANKGKVLTTNSFGFPEWADPTGGEIDASDLATVDKISGISAEGDFSNINTDNGLYWTDSSTITADDNDYDNIASINRVPITAGENVTFEIDEEKKLVKINAKGGGSSAPSVSLIGTWTVIDDPTIPTSDLPLEFTSNNGQTYMAIGTTSMGSSSWGINALSYQVKDAGYYDTAYVNNPSGQYGISHGWKNEHFKYITITKEPTDANAIAWLGANTDAPKVELPKEEMPQIRFTSANGSDMNGDTTTFFVDEQNPLKLTVEVVGGGALKVGDALQVCVRKRFNGSMANGNRRKYKLQRFAEYVVTEDDLNKRYLTVYIACGTEDNKVAYRGLFRDGNTQDLSPLYLRIRRPKGGMQANDSGQTVDAEFSNIVTIWKATHRGNQVIRIY